MVSIVLGLAVSQVSAAAIPAAVYLPAMAAFGVSFGVWLSIRSRATARAMMWYMAVAGGLLLVPLAIVWGFDEGESLLAAGILSTAAVVVAVGAWTFWHRACLDFDRYGRE
jgi:hypothetical protein